MMQKYGDLIYPEAHTKEYGRYFCDLILTLWPLVNFNEILDM